jgi:uncharacterized protein YkwD
MPQLFRPPASLWAWTFAVSALAAAPVALPRADAPNAAALEDRVLELVNVQRGVGGSCGAQRLPPSPPLVMHDRLRRAARGHSERMAAARFYSHVSPEGTSFGDRIYQAGYAGAFPWGENIAAGYETPDAVMDAWMRDGTHCRQILSARYRAIGVGYAYRARSPFGHYWTQTFGGG